MPDTSVHEQNDGSTVIVSWFDKDELQDLGYEHLDTHRLDDGTHVPVYVDQQSRITPAVVVGPDSKAPKAPPAGCSIEDLEKYLDDTEKYLLQVEADRASVRHNLNDVSANLAAAKKIASSQKEYNVVQTIDRPAVISRDELAVVVESKGGRLRSIPRRLRAQVRRTAEALRLEKVADAVGRAFGKGKSLARKALGPINVVGPWNILGALLSCQAGRDLVRSAAARAAQVVTAPVRFLGRLAGRLLNRFGWGKKVVTAVAKRYEQATAWIAKRFDAGMTWLDEREHSGAMRWTRAYCQSRIMSLAIGQYVPSEYRTGAYIASLFVPTVGVGGIGTESKASLLNATEAIVVDEAERVAKAAAASTKVTPAPARGTSKDVVKTETVKTFFNGTEGEGTMYTDLDGDVWFKVDGTLMAPSDVPDELLIGERAVRAAKRHREEQAVLLSVAAAAGPAPQNRAARRAAEKATGGK